MTIPATIRKLFWASFFCIVACSTQAELLKITAGENNLVLDSTHIERLTAGEDTAGNSFVLLALSETGTAVLANFTASHIGKDLEIFHGSKKVYGKVPLRDKLAMKEIFISVENKMEANKLVESIESRLQHRTTPDR